MRSSNTQSKCYLPNGIIKLNALSFHFISFHRQLYLYFSSSFNAVAKIHTTQFRSTQFNCVSYLAVSGDMGSTAGKSEVGTLKSPTHASQAVELGTIHYINLTPNRKHGDFQAALAAAAETGKPIFANFVEWSG